MRSSAGHTEGQCMATPEATLAVFRASRPRCRHSADVLAFFVHAATTSAGYRLLAVGPKADDLSTLDALAQTDPSVDPLDGWNAWDDAHAFRYVPETTTGARHVQEEWIENANTFLVLNSMLVGDVSVISACVVKQKTQNNPGSSHSASLEIQLDTYIDASLVSSDPVLSILDPSALCAELNEGLFSLLSPALPASTSGDTYVNRADSAGRGTGADATNTETYPGGGTHVGPATGPGFGRGLPPPGPPPGARFDPYGPPDVPEFAPGRFGGEYPSEYNTHDPLRGFPENPDNVFGGVPDGLGPGGFPRGGPGRGGLGFPPPGWPPARGRGRGPPDTGGFPPPQGGGGFL